ncbi:MULTISPECIES: cytochrome o ubiquinol oxidase subunit III [Rhodanobacter]|jgi:cytochrome o ubiquinol oxidase subunit 3|uniref:Cytochrome bo(3) ubiquinol oxidase subunit 3 n=1 Tax=Rhodanobacter glycinis TaxID=582702 RepID=A0A1I4D5X5_9GAMM|nr:MULTISPECIES: cytochrome o ubiquinol oxidase subunit III [Rhodanobacter]EIL87392.1 cytochrome ubiquinol oxidase subunit III [Rhodanobacter sp. 115]QEE23675.1 cytochrome o ubiquinol oxidase subunit III [Rhodanobacter glycinis]TAM19117.1 MAG: cytochrome o ubiquinol oxidase subunit III [Rhodanobacter sp.]SFK87827.1 cytochrome bo3 quinol oxidase subunit 3 [Rhodanobacter glycinis]
MNTTAIDTAGTAPSRFICHEEPPVHNGTLLGFWIYLMSDCFIFASLFACNAVLGTNYAGGPSAAQVLDLPGLAVNTALLLISSVTFGFAMLEMARRNQRAMLGWLAVSGLLAAAFVGLEIHEFAGMIAEGAGPDRSAFLSSFFTLVGTHGLHVSVGILWLIVLMVQTGKFGLTEANIRRLRCLSMFWHFLDLVWVGVFSYVYLAGVLR